MNSHPNALEDLQERLSKLEKQNRRFKHLGIAALVVPALLLVMGQAPSKKTVEANEFILRDDNGNVRARLFMTPKETLDSKALFPDVSNPTNIPVVINPTATLAFYNEKGQVKAGYDENEVTVYDLQGDVAGGFGIPFGSLAQTGSVHFDPNSAALTLNGPDKSTSVLGSGVLVITDQQGFKAVLGPTDLVTKTTGETHKTSAASLTLFNSKGNVIWNAP
jgi:hypothetical protein